MAETGRSASDAGVDAPPHPPLDRSGPSEARSYAPWKKYSAASSPSPFNPSLVADTPSSPVVSDKVSNAVGASAPGSRNYSPFSKVAGNAKYGTSASTPSSSARVAVTSSSPIVSDKVSGAVRASAPSSQNYSPFSKVGDIERKARGSGVRDSNPVAATVTKAVNPIPVTRASTTRPSSAVKGDQIASAGKTYAPWKKYGAASASTPSSSTRVAAISSSPIVSDKVSGAVRASAPSTRNYSPFSKVGDIERKARGSGVGDSNPVAAATTK
eukprot:gene11468-14648_t